MLDLELLEAGDVILIHPVSGVHPIADGIAWVQGEAGATHNACYLARDEIIEAEPVGVIRASLKKYLNGSYLVTVRRLKNRLTAQEQAKVISFWVSKVGAKYDFKQIFGLFLLNMARKLGIGWAVRGIQNLYADPDRFICSELWVKGIRLVRRTALGPTPSDNVQPRLLYKDERDLQTIAVYNPAGRKV